MRQNKNFLPQEHYTFWGYSIAVRSNSRDILEYIQAIYERCITPPGHQESTHSSLYVLNIIDDIDNSNELILQSERETHRLKCKDLHRFDYDYYTSEGTVPNPLAYVQWFVLDNACFLAKEYQLIHAGAVSWDGKGVIFPGISGMGKTTLTIKLVQSGCRFLSDEIAALQPDQEVVEPFFRRINLSDHSRKMLNLPSFSGATSSLKKNSECEWMLDIEDIVPDSLSVSCPLKYIIFLRGFGERARLQQFSNSNALFKLFKFSFSPLKNPTELLFNFSSLLNNVECYNLIAGNLDETTDTLLTLVEKQT